MTTGPSEHSDRHQDVVERAMGLPACEREEFVRRAFGGNAQRALPALRLLADAVRVEQMFDVCDDDERPEEIGPYRLLEVLGEGGMGTVYKAEQQFPVRRTVALKLIKLGMDSRAIVARFEHERQALALMDHEGIAKVFDCGTGDRGQPFFVMELVNGEPLADYCRRTRATLPTRLRLIQQVCAAITHAHQKGIVHRDLKPGNVLVSDEQGEPRIRVIDFGLAKAMGEKLVEATMFTAAGHLVGTLEYMAPEQVESDHGDVDTRADVYAIGVMLYELLCGLRPFSSEQLRAGGVSHMQRVLRETEPPLASAKLASGAGPATVAAELRMSPSALQRALKSDLDWIVAKAIEKDRSRRYPSASSLADDLQRYLDDEPVAAGPPSVAYRVRKLLRRHRVLFLSGAAVFLTMFAGGAVAWAQAIENGALASREREANDQLQNVVRDFRQLSVAPALDRLLANYPRLGPPWPTSLADRNLWLEEARGLLAMEGEIRGKIDELQGRAVLDTVSILAAADPESLEAVARQRSYVRSLRYARAIRGGEQQPSGVELTADTKGCPPHVLNARAWYSITPDPEERLFWGKEGHGLACAQAAVARQSRHDRLNCLAWALLANGQDAQAREVSARALRAAPPEDRQEYEQWHEKLLDHLDRTAEILSEAERKLAELSGERGSWVFPDTPAGRADAALHWVATEFALRIDELKGLCASMERQCRWAAAIHQATISHPGAHVSWAEVRRLIEANRRYPAEAADFDVGELLGLVPLGANPSTGLLEFYHLRSAWDGTLDPSAIPIPSRRPDGTFEVGAATGIIFVLLPGGTELQGSQDLYPADERFEKDRNDNEVIHPVTLAPFLMAAHEMTQAQWSRLAAGCALSEWPSLHRPGDRPAGVRIEPWNPVESVSWIDCEALMRRSGLMVPTEAQWEHGCRAGQDQPFCVARSRLFESANLADESAAGQSWVREPWSDGCVVHAPVGTFLPNVFGLYDMHGNVSEWCRDWFGPYGFEQAPEGVSTARYRNTTRIHRGGGFRSRAREARSAMRLDALQGSGSNDRGVRAARRFVRGAGN